jgi:hypothetical protein
MEATTKRGRMAICAACFLLAFSVFLLAAAVRGLRQANQVLQTQKQIQPLMDKSLQLGEQINAELWAAMEESNAIAAESAKPLDQRSIDLDQRRILNKQRMEGIRELLAEQQRVNNQIRAIQKQNGVTTENESPETKAVLEKY